MVLTRVDNTDLWGPFESVDDGILISLVGRIALSEEEWNEAQKCDREGGLACKAVFLRYKRHGIEGLEDLNGGFIVILFDPKCKKIHIVTDRCGMNLCFKYESNDRLLLSSHTDALALAANEERNWDYTSLAEFLRTSKVSFPYTYYKKIEALDFGCIYTIDLSKKEKTLYSKKKYFTFDYKIDPKVTEWELAEELGRAVKKAVEKRTLSFLCSVGVFLSGGLDSRTMLSSIKDKARVKVFCIFDKENNEVRIARKIAETNGVEFIPLQRHFDYYGDHAEVGVKICGGMGDIRGNHFLGFRDTFKEHKIDTLISGKNCDWLFKGLAVDRKLCSYIGTGFKIEKMDVFKYQYYYAQFKFKSKYSDDVEERLFSIYPESLRNDQSDVAKLKIAEKRIIPLYYEPDNAETVISQRVFPWYLPIVDNDIINVYLKIPPRYKLNNSLWQKMVTIVCDKKILKIPDSNTGLTVNASNFKRFIHYHVNKRREEKSLKYANSIATEISWPNWEYYIHNSKKIETLWFRENKVAKEVFTMILGFNPYQKKIQEYKKTEVSLFLRLLTLKLWLDQRD